MKKSNTQAKKINLEEMQSKPKKYEVAINILSYLLTHIKIEESYSKFGDKIGIDSRQTLSHNLNILLNNGYLIKLNGSKQVCINKDKYDEISEKLDTTDSLIKLQRTIAKKFLEQHSEDELANIKLHERQPGYLDINAIVHPTISVGLDLKIVEKAISAPFKSFYYKREDYSILDFLKQDNFFLYDFKNDNIIREQNGVFNSVYNSLLQEGRAKKDICIATDNGNKFYTLYMVTQSSFLGLQAIMVDQTEKVNENRQNVEKIHKQIHYVKLLKDIHHELQLSNDSNKNSILKKLEKITDYKYLSIYGHEKEIKSFRKFNLTKNIQTIIEELNYLYPESTELTYNQESEDCTLNSAYDINLYDALFIFLEKLKKYSVESDIKINSHQMIINTSIKIPKDIESYIHSLNEEIEFRADALPSSHLDLEFFINKLNKKTLGLVMAGTYFKHIEVSPNKQNILVKFKNKKD